MALTKSSTLNDVRAAVETAFAPDIELGVNEQGHIYSRSPKTSVGYKWMRAVHKAGISDIDKAIQHCASLGIEATIETH